MICRLTRRQILASLAATAAISPIEAAFADGGLKLGEPIAFSYAGLTERAKQMAGEPYKEPPRPSPEILDKIDYETWGKIVFDTDYALFANGPGRFPVSFFHLGKFFPKPMAIHMVNGSEAREIIYDQRYFAMPADSPARQLPEGVGFAGFRIQEARDGKLDWRKNDWVAFLGASYFRAIGELYEYGISARGLALDTAVNGRAEEFPGFTEIYVAEPNLTDTVTVYALLEGPSATGAYKFVMTRGKGVVMDIDQTLFLRKAVSRFGIAPLTSMYWFSETMKPTAIDWRPEVHDSDGLAMWTGWGEHLWRPLNNPPHIVVSAFGDDNPKGFGLLQRDRVFDHYQDGVHYERRPTLWVEPIGSWGKGAVQLVEIPTDDEIHDNIVAMWVPEKPATPGAEFNIAYKLHWLADEPYPTDLARCVATRLGNGGQPGQPRPKGVRKFTVEFLGGLLASLQFGMKPDMVMQASRGAFTDYKIMEAVPDGVPGHWRAQFDLANVEGTEPVEMRLYLTVDNKVATETWLFQYHPF
jgi:glucans biosynthesis protein